MIARTAKEEYMDKTFRESIWITGTGKARIENLKTKAQKCYGWDIDNISFNNGYHHAGQYHSQAFFTVVEGENHFNVSPLAPAGEKGKEDER